MTLEAGTNLGPYEILSPLGAGDMGEVYRARDSKLSREVAIKVLPEEFTQHPEKLARFEREARLLAALNHPGIATLHGLEEAEGKPFLVMELIEGETLAERIARGPFPVDEALAVAQQIAEALEAAHEKGVIHRDLKPANIKVDPEGQVKVLDFGLAKAFAEETPESDASFSPTLSREATQAGVILGTAAYMSPEQAKGKTVDKRTDIFSFGIVLFEMLTGKKAFAGEDVSDVLAAILRSEPDWGLLPAGVSPAVVKLLRRCLAKDRKDRLRDIGDARLELQDVAARGSAEADSAGTGDSRRLVSMVGVGALILGAVLASAFWWQASEGARDPRVRRLGITVQSGGGRFAVSGDGRRIVYVSVRPDGTRVLLVREMDGLEPREIAGTERAGRPVFSPDGEEIVFHVPRSGGRPTGSLMRVRLDGGRPLEIVPGVGAMRWAGLDWGPDDTVVFSTGGDRPGLAGGLARVAAGGGEARLLTSLDDEKGERYHLEPHFLPGGKSVLFSVVLETGDQHSEVLSLETRERERLEGVGPYARYLPSGHLVYPSEEALIAVPFDLDARERVGRERVLEVEIARGVDAWRPITPPRFDWARDGTLVYAPADDTATGNDALVWVDREGREQSLGIVLDGVQQPRRLPMAGA